MDDRRWQDLSDPEKSAYGNDSERYDKAQSEAGIEPAKRQYKRREPKAPPPTFKVVYLGEPNDGLPDDHTVEAFGKTFTRGEEVEMPLNDPDIYGLLERIDGNPHFDYAGERPKLPDHVGPAANPQPIADPSTYQAKA